MMRIDVLNFSGIYDQEAFYRDVEGLRLLDLTGISGTNCMCDDAAKELLVRAIGGDGSDGDGRESVPGSQAPRGLHFIDNGNYHYVSAIYTGFIREPFSLVVLDHHPDMQRPMFDILSCGGWVLNVIENNPFVRDIHIIGADAGLISQLDEKSRERVKFYDNPRVLPETQYPIYLSIDKDVISRDELVTNWDQGDLTREQVLAFVKALLTREGSVEVENADGNGHGIIGVDICGECAPEQEDCDLDAAIAGNQRFNREVMQEIVQIWADERII